MRCYNLVSRNLAKLTEEITQEDRHGRTHSVEEYKPVLDEQLKQRKKYIKIYTKLQLNIAFHIHNYKFKLS